MSTPTPGRCVDELESAPPDKTPLLWIVPIKAAAIGHNKTFPLIGGERYIHAYSHHRQGSPIPTEISPEWLPFPARQVYLVSPQKDLEAMLADAYLDNPALQRMHKLEVALHQIIERLEVRSDDWLRHSYKVRPEVQECYQIAIEALKRVTPSDTSPQEQPRG